MKYSVIIAIILICCILISCNSEVSPIDTGSVSESIETPTQAPTQNIESDEAKESETLYQPLAPSISYDTVAFGDYSAYKEFIDSTELPSNFVYYEDVDFLGEFLSLVFLTFAQYGDYSEVMYSFTDSTNILFTLYVEEKTFTYSELVTSTKIDAVNATDMREISSEEHGIYTHEGIEYLYKYGKILSIRWKSGGRAFTLSSIDEFVECEDISKSNIAAVFNLETASEFIASIAPVDPVE